MAHWERLVSDQLLMSSELNGLASGAGALSTTAVSNDATSTQGHMGAVFELVALTYASAPAAGAAIELYLPLSHDGTNYEDVTTGASGVGPASGLRWTYSMFLVNTAKRYATPILRVDPLKFKAFVINRGTTALHASTPGTLRYSLFRLVAD